MVSEELVNRLSAHRTLGAAPRAQLEWLASHGQLQRLAAGEIAVRYGQPITELWVVLSGRVVFHSARGGVLRRVAEWRGGDVSGTLPYSRLSTAIGDATVEEDAEVLTIPSDCFPEMIRECHDLTATLVHQMLDRARSFTSSDFQAEKMASLGRLAAGLAHELNNPASAVVRSARALSARLPEVEAAFRAIGEAGVSSKAAEAFEQLSNRCLPADDAAPMTALERSAREDALADWLVTHDVDSGLAEGLTETGVSVTQLDVLARQVDDVAIQSLLRALGAGCGARMLASEIERAATRIHDLVASVKGFTYMDQASVPTPVDVARGLSDTLAVLRAKAKAKSITVTLDVAPNLPRINGFGGELNQVWVNLIDNAIDAVPPNGRVTISVSRHHSFLVVSIVDNGSGIPVEVREHLFEPFFTTKPAGEGTGLGLNIARRLVEQHAGTIEVESEPGRTSFCVRLPLPSGEDVR